MALEVADINVITMQSVKSEGEKNDSVPLNNVKLNPDQHIPDENGTYYRPV